MYQGGTLQWIEVRFEADLTRVDAFWDFLEGVGVVHVLHVDFRHML